MVALESATEAAAISRGGFPRAIVYNSSMCADKICGRADDLVTFAATLVPGY